MKKELKEIRYASYTNFFVDSYEGYDFNQSKLISTFEQQIVGYEVYPSTFYRYFGKFGVLAFI